MMPPPPPPPPPPSHHHNPHTLEANGRYQRKPPPTGVIVYLNLVNAVTQLLIGAVACCAFTFANSFGFASAFTQHIYLCVIGYVILMSQAILSFNTHAGWAYSLKYPQKKLIHSAMQVLGAAFAIIGSIIRLVDTGAELRSAHAITGFIAMFLTFLSLIGGLFHFIFSGDNNNALFKIVHTCFGSLTMTVAFICLCLGFTSRWYRLIYGDINANIAIAFTVLALSGVLISAFSRTLMRIIFD